MRSAALPRWRNDVAGLQGAPALWLYSSCSCNSTTDQPCQPQHLTDKQKFFLSPEATEALENSCQAGGEPAFPIPCLCLYWSAANVSSKHISLAILIFLPPILPGHGEAAPSLAACSHSPDPFVSAHYGWLCGKQSSVNEHQVCYSPIFLYVFVARWHM